MVLWNGHAVNSVVNDFPCAFGALPPKHFPNSHRGRKGSFYAPSSERASTLEILDDGVAVGSKSLPREQPFPTGCGPEQISGVFMASCFHESPVGPTPHSGALPSWDGLTPGRSRKPQHGGLGTHNAGLSGDAGGFADSIGLSLIDVLWQWWI